ncbi:hypothetical protein KUX45_24040, partial [Salmonella enterica subsp. enterica serovar Kentucky]|nr:hypothetical protein [Salmonella enterica subsp. enterica serovar Kentucky]
DELFTQLSEARSIQLAAKNITLTLRPSSLVVVADAELLAQALESMRIKLEGKNEIEQYVYALTHELKSPLAAIRGAAEI